ncbi:sulfurtransferase TusA family protein [Paraburkholderia fungorum]|uniref:sulfurtransferase TusA family protein n=2 Tax=Paraburkholderia fungorum TaxID=134537 RepID=UPI00402B7E07
MDHMKIDKELDTRGRTCPLPLLSLRRLLSQMQPGEVTRVIVSDEASAREIPAFAQRKGNDVLLAEHHDGEWTFTIRRA